MPRPSRDADELLVCADVLGAFGVTASDIGRDAGDAALEDALADILADGRDRTTVLRRTIAGSERGVSCSARYPREALERELTAAFGAIDWSFGIEPLGTGSRERLTLYAIDHRGRRRETTFEYPETPLGTDNLPAVLRAINVSLLSGTDARFALLSSGVDRWQAALVDERELERLRDRYGERVETFDRPLLPETDLAAYVPTDGSDSPTSGAATRNSGTTADGPWPTWALERVDRPFGTDDGRSGTDDARADRNDTRSDEDDAADRDEGGVESLIEEAEPVPESDGADASAEEIAPGSETGTSTIDGFELRGSSRVSRVPGTAGEPDDERATSRREDAGTGTPESSSRNEVSTDGNRETGTDDWSLSGTATTARVSNDSFGTADAPQSEEDRYQAFGAALTTGRDVSVEGLLEDDDFLPELPAAESRETRIEFANAFDPAAVREAKAAAEQSGFVWVDSGTLETTRVSNG